MKNTIWATLVGLALVVGSTSSSLAQTSSRDMIACQKKIIGQVQALTRLSARKLQGCADKVVRCKLASEIDGVDPTDCLANATDICGKVGPALTDVIAKRRENMLKKCGLIPIAELEQYIAGLGFLNVSTSCGSLAPPLSPIPVADAADLVDCLLTTAECAVEREVFLRDPRALDSLTEAGVDATFPCAGS